MEKLRGSVHVQSKIGRNEMKNENLKQHATGNKISCKVKRQTQREAKAKIGFEGPPSFYQTKLCSSPIVKNLQHTIPRFLPETIQQNKDFNYSQTEDDKGKYLGFVDNRCGSN